MDETGRKEQTIQVSDEVRCLKRGDVTKTQKLSSVCELKVKEDGPTEKTRSWYFGQDAH